ncbi:MAG: hypothetical protein V2I36_16380 [Desulfopila sp.]|jgi:hypothetical protein|nr:hypothetical protein [Desulfopila sp.]
MHETPLQGIQPNSMHHSITTVSIANGFMVTALRKTDDIESVSSKISACRISSTD